MKAYFGEVDEADVDWRSIAITGDEDDDDDDEVLDQTPPHVVEMLGFDPLDQDVEDGFNPDQPRDPKGSPTGGQWTAASDLQGYLRQVSGIYGDRPSVAKFLLDNGRSYSFGPESFEGPRGESKMCFMNAGRAAMGNSDLTYVEGYITMMGVPIQHAWNIDKMNRVIDPTLKDGKGVGEYFGVPFKTEYLAKTVMKNKYWGLLGEMSHKTLIPLIEGKEKNFLKDS